MGDRGDTEQTSKVPVRLCKKDDDAPVRLDFHIHDDCTKYLCIYKSANSKYIPKLSTL